LQQSGAHQETECAFLYFETGALSQDQMSTFAGLVEKGVEDIASFLSVPAKGSKGPLFHQQPIFDLAFTRPLDLPATG
jgi:hypothetical protein